MSRRKAMLVVSLPLAVLLGAAFLLDLLVAASTSWLFLGVVAALGMLAAAIALVLSRRLECLAPLVPFAAILCFLHLADTSPLKPFARFYNAIEPGMTDAEVFGALNRQFLSTGRYPQPVVNRRVGPAHIEFILDPSDGRYDAEIVAVDVEEGRVLRKQYYGD